MLFGLAISEPTANASTEFAEDPPTEEIAICPTALDARDPRPPELPKTALGGLRSPQGAVSSETLTIDPGPPDLPPLDTSKAPQAIAVAAKPPLGIDLAARGHEVRLLLNAGFGIKMSARGYDPDDVLQEVYRGLLARNKGKCPFDPDKSSFGHYVHMVCDCVLKNYHRKQARRAQFEVIGLKVPPSMVNSKGDAWTEADAAIAAVDDGNMGHPSSPLQMNRAQDPSEDIAEGMAVSSLDHWFEIESHIARRAGDKKRADAMLTVRTVLPLKAQGLTRSEIATSLDLPVGQVSKALAALRAGTRQWAVQQGLRPAEA
jgi:DNA-directed RNA polymerase specialized sigma24 family protein